MKTRKRITALTITALLTVGMTLNFSGCSKETTMGPTLEQEQKVDSLAKGKGKALGLDKQEENTNNGVGQDKQDQVRNSYPQNDEKELIWDEEAGAYEGGTLRVANGSQFHISDYVAIPPNGISNGKKRPINITMNVNKVSNAHGEVLEFTFGPSGTHFLEPAEIRLNWEDLGLKNNEVPDFYYIEENGEYKKQNPSKVDKGNKWLYLYVDHFSRYALAHSE
jgi:hypothetical protein